MLENMTCEVKLRGGGGGEEINTSRQVHMIRLIPTYLRHVDGTVVDITNAII